MIWIRTIEQLQRFSQTTAATGNWTMLQLLLPLLQPGTRRTTCIDAYRPLKTADKSIDRSIKPAPVSINLPTWRVHGICFSLYRFQSTSWRHCDQWTRGGSSSSSSIRSIHIHRQRPETKSSSRCRKRIVAESVFVLRRLTTRPCLHLQCRGAPLEPCCCVSNLKTKNLKKNRFI